MNTKYSSYHLYKKGEKEIYRYTDLLVCVCLRVETQETVPPLPAGRGSRWLGTGWEEEFSLYSRGVFLILEPYECITYRKKTHRKFENQRVHMCVFLRRIRAFIRSSKGTEIPESLKTLHLHAVQPWKSALTSLSPTRKMGRNNAHV